jgi:hypothetical protein
MSRVVVHPPELAVTEVVVARPPPPVRVEQVPPPPSGGPPEMFVWQPGHWRWDGHDYALKTGYMSGGPSIGRRLATICHEARVR